MDRVIRRVRSFHISRDRDHYSSGSESPSFPDRPRVADPDPVPQSQMLGPKKSGSNLRERYAYSSNVEKSSDGSSLSVNQAKNEDGVEEGEIIEAVTTSTPAPAPSTPARSPNTSTADKKAIAKTLEELCNNSPLASPIKSAGKSTSTSTSTSSPQSNSKTLKGKNSMTKMGMGMGGMGGTMSKAVGKLAAPFKVPFQTSKPPLPPPGTNRETETETKPTGQLSAGFKVPELPVPKSKSKSGLVERLANLASLRGKVRESRVERRMGMGMGMKSASVVDLRDAYGYEYAYGHGSNAGHGYGNVIGQYGY